MKEKMLGYLQVIGFKVFQLLGGKMLSKILASAYKAGFARHAKVYFSSSTRKMNIQQLILARKAINKADFKAKLNTLTVASMVIAGDAFGSYFIRINRKIAANIPNSNFVILNQAMDPSCLTNPHRFN